MSFYRRSCETSLCCTLVVYEILVRACVAELIWVGETQEDLDTRCIWTVGLHVDHKLMTSLQDNRSQGMPLGNPLTKTKSVDAIFKF